VAILERPSAPNGQTSSLPSTLPAPTLHRRRHSPQLHDTAEGVIETFTIVHVTPDGFLAPLGLALIRASDGSLLMAQGEADAQLKIGQEVYIRRMEGLHLFTVKSQFQRVQEAFARLWRRRTHDKSKETSAGGSR